MPPPDSSAIDTAVLQKLSADTTLLGLMPNGVWFDEAPPQSTRYVIVSLIDSDDARRFEGRSHERVVYLIKAVALTTVANANADVRAAAARIDALLDPQPPAPPGGLTVPDYGYMVMHRDPLLARIRHTELDAIDPTIKFYHRGAHYTVMMSTLP